VISEWFFKTQQRAREDQQTDKKHKVTVDDHRTSPVAGSSDGLNANDVPLQTTVSDDTITANYMECSNTINDAS